MNNSLVNVFNDIFENFGSNRFINYHIIETSAGKRLEVVAPGLDKSLFKVRLDKNTSQLHIQHPGEKFPEESRQALKYPAVDCNFAVRGLKISEVKYVDGILIIDFESDVKPEEFIEVK